MALTLTPRQPNIRPFEAKACEIKGCKFLSKWVAKYETVIAPYQIWRYFFDYTIIASLKTSIFPNMECMNSWSLLCMLFSHFVLMKQALRKVLRSCSSQIKKDKFNPFIQLKNLLGEFFFWFNKFRGCTMYI